MRRGGEGTVGRVWLDVVLSGVVLCVVRGVVLCGVM